MDNRHHRGLMAGLTWTLAPLDTWDGERRHWQSLHRESGASALFDTDFITPFLAAAAVPGTLIARASRDGRTLAMAVLARQQRGSWATLQPPQLPLGLWLQAPEADQGTLVRSLLPRLPGHALLLGLTQRDPLLERRPPDGPRVRSSDYIRTAAVPLAGTFDEYWAGRGKNLRTNLKKQRARLRQDAIPTRLEQLRHPDQVGDAIRDYARLESTGWKGAEGTAVAPGNAQALGYTGMLEAFCARGAARIYRFYLGEQLAAMDLCIEDGDQLVVLKTSYDESLAGHLSPALLMREEIMQGLFSEGRFGRVEFYGKVMDWHLRWTDQLRTLYHVNYYRWPGLGALHQWAHQARR